jgi:methionyl-tRNA formyltransferase
MHPVTTGPALAPNALDTTTGSLIVGAANHTLLALDEVQLEGKPRLPGVQFALDFQLRPGEHLE